MQCLGLQSNDFLSQTIFDHFYLKLVLTKQIEIFQDQTVKKFCEIRNAAEILFQYYVTYLSFVCNRSLMELLEICQNRDNVEYSLKVKASTYAMVSGYIYTFDFCLLKTLNIVEVDRSVQFFYFSRNQHKLYTIFTFP